MGTKTRQLSNTLGKDIQWESVRYADGSTVYNAAVGQGFLLDTTGGEIEIVLPSNPSQGDAVGIIDHSGTFGTNRCVIGRGGSKIRGLELDAQLITNNTIAELVYTGSEQGWIVVENSVRTALTVDDPYIPPSIICAEGGCKTIDGNYAVHTFTSSGCFVVNSICGCASPGNVDYLVVAGGGANGNNRYGGGGGGGFREGKNTSDPLASPHTASPLAANSGITVTATTYPISVGAAGVPGPGPQNNYNGRPGGSSSFSNITSAGGGGGGSAFGPTNGQSGGSGGGAGGESIPPWATGSGGGGNSPPVAPPQGNSGGPTPGPSGGGGGGASQSASGGQATPGGDGAETSISGVAKYYSGGGGGCGYQQPGTPGQHGFGNGPNTGAGGGGISKVPCVPAGVQAGTVILRYRIYA